MRTIEAAEHSDNLRRGRTVFSIQGEGQMVDAPSIPPKPTLESLPAWTRCKVEPVNVNLGVWDVVKKPSGSLVNYYSGNDFEWVNVKLISIYNPKTEQWEDV